MRVTGIQNAVLLAAMIALGSVGTALAQTNGADAHHSANSSQAAEPSGMGGMMGQGQSMMPNASAMMPKGMQCMTMQPGTMSGMPVMGMNANLMKIMFAIADTDGDGSLSFDEVTAIHKRIFDAMDANKDGKVTLEEMQAFWRQ